MENSKIEWTHHTHNEWIGCTKVSAGCKNCYAETLMDKRYQRAVWGEGENSSRYLTSIQNRNKPFAWNKQAQKEGIRYRVFAQSLSDTFEKHKNQEINALLIEWRIALFEKIKATTHLDWLVLTKRPEVAELFYIDYPQFSNLPNVWLGVSVENQETANLRIPILLGIPAKVRFLSCEPLLGDIMINMISTESYTYFPLRGQGVKIGTLQHTKTCKNDYKSTTYDTEKIPKIDWVIVGGESGHNARPMHTDWVRSIRNQCLDANVPFFFKQWGEFNEFGEKVGKHKAGRLLEGREYNEMPKI